ncbi:unnamed protein product [Penicillium nalgiovense]|uniref:Uncharacterized protein n=1 Tax=Penicillium nalgiovense TaxID=60175 RepID=A0A9W4HNQ9_PENNA|nr:unnamed protein product [Penicillium nalgiovense]CAG7944113.1 unnamed protein product [Penicillium nalgiovense]CAG7951054.1 unnamed protein product [Penicillium nalgiovense]CAG7957226.1 unnamed protein product [Penicillium nalgiovense]CAG7965587.1 unnamed protein product [Penicillium nalgiovense]
MCIDVTCLLFLCLSPLFFFFSSLLFARRFACDCLPIISLRNLYSMVGYIGSPRMYRMTSTSTKDRFWMPVLAR